MLLNLNSIEFHEIDSETFSEAGERTNNILIWRKRNIMLVKCKNP